VRIAHPIGEAFCLLEANQQKMELKPRDVQTQVKHRILEKYLKTWGGIVLNGLKGTAAQMQRYGKQLGHNFVYVDCFAYCGRYSCNVEDTFQEHMTGPVPGSPIIGIRVLDELVGMARRYNIDLKINAVLIEKEPEVFDNLLAILSDEGLIHRVRETTNFSDLKPGEIAVVNADSTQMASKLLAYTRRDYTKAFYLLDTYGPSGIPYDFVRSIISNDGHDVMINFLYYDLQKKTGLVQIPPYQSPPQSPHIAYWTAAFGSEEWIEIVREIRVTKGGRDALLEELGLSADEVEGDPLFEEIEQGDSPTDKQLTELTERKLVDLYRAVLLEMDPALTVKTIRLRFPDKERPMYHLFLTTHDPTGALALNKILFDAKIREYELRYIRRCAKRQQPPEGQLRLFSLDTVQMAVPKPEIPERPTVEECAEATLQRFSGRAATRRDVYRELANEIYFDTEVDKAIRYLRKTGRADYSGKLAHDLLIEFFDN
jgi:three-Cys-motif partner protein